jgi:nucleoid-associated protein YgaU
MTSEAKIGLLLGLVFIFIIAFIINGLPSFWSKSDGGEVAAVTENPQDTAVGIGANEKKAGEAIERIEPGTAVNNNGVVVESQGGSEVRFVAEPPKGVTNASANAELKPAVTEQAPPAELREPSPVVQSPKLVEQRTYVVSEGDSLYTIAKKFYGAAAAGKKATINSIFNANRNTLKSPDMLYVGQKLTIPQLTDTQAKKSKTENVAVNTAKTQPTGSANVVAGDSQTKSASEYVVQSGDSLWKIAAKQLGNGARFEEIASLNEDVLDGGEDLTVGMRLKLPTR